MSTSVESNPQEAAAAPAPAPLPIAPGARVPKLLRWAVRITSLPVFGMLVLTAIPALMNFSLSTKQDKILAVALCGIGIGFLIGWRWAGVGGMISLLSIAVTLKEADSSIFADPFSIAFSIQSLLFLISWAVDSPVTQPASEIGLNNRVLWKRAVAAMLGLAAIGGVWAIIHGPPPTPIAHEREAFVGTWESGSGLTFELTSDGRAKVTEAKDGKVPPCNTPVAPGETREFSASFLTDDQLELSSGTLGPSKVYHVDRRPFTQNKEIRMVLNGSDPYVRTNGLVLTKRQIAAQKPSAQTQKKS